MYITPSLMIVYEDRLRGSYFGGSLCLQSPRRQGPALSIPRPMPLVEIPLLIAKGSDAFTEITMGGPQLIR